MVYEVNLWPFRRDGNFTLRNAFFSTAKITKNAKKDKYKYSGYGIGFENHETFSLSNGSEKNVIFFEADLNSSVHVYNRKKDILILGKVPTDGLDDTTLIAEKEYSINFTEQNKKICLSLHYNGANSCILVNGVEIHKFKTKDFEIKATPLCLGNI